MSFAAFSKEFASGMFSSVDTRFITNYLPLAGRDAARV